MWWKERSETPDLNSYHVIGIMSGTSCDGLDIAYCQFPFNNNQWRFNLLHATTSFYNEHWEKRIKTFDTISGVDLIQTNSDYGYYIGGKVKEFINEHNIQADFIASHGHTVFHQPEKGYTYQIGHGAAIASTTGLLVVCDFRSLDVALGGQGAPLVPIGDKLLFSEYDYCLNLGGFANISFENEKIVARQAYDICPCNIVLNELSNQCGKSYDDGGEMAQSGELNNDLLNELNQLEYYQKAFPKSLGKEWVQKHINPLLEQYDIPIQDKLRTLCEHMSQQIALCLKNDGNKQKVLITGGGAYNHFLIECIKKHTPHSIVIPEKNIIDFKEAIIFAFLGVLRMRNEINCLASVTGAKKDSSSGVIFLP